LKRYYYEVENPLVKVLTDMEYEGVKIDESFLNEYSKELEKEAKKSEEVCVQTGRSTIQSGFAKTTG
jgi:DNA polymerase-1